MCCPASDGYIGAMPTPSCPWQATQTCAEAGALPSGLPARLERFAGEIRRDVPHVLIRERRCLRMHRQVGAIAVAIALQCAHDVLGMLAFELRHAVVGIGVLVVRECRGSPRQVLESALPCAGSACSWADSAGPGERPMPTTAPARPNATSNLMISGSRNPRKTAAESYGLAPAIATMTARSRSGLKIMPSTGVLGAGTSAYHDGPYPRAPE